MTKVFSLVWTRFSFIVVTLMVAHSMSVAEPQDHSKPTSGSGSASSQPPILINPSTNQVLYDQLTLPMSAADSRTQWSLPIDDAQYEKVVNEYVNKLPDVVTVTQRVMQLFHKATDYAVHEAETKGQFAGGSFTDPELGKADFVEIDGSQVVRIIEPMGNEILFVHSLYVSQNSKELMNYISRQNSVAENKGRNLIVVWHGDQQTVESAETHTKARRWSLKFWKGYLAAVHQPATLDSFCFGLMGGLAQATLTAILGVVKYGFTSHVAILSASVFGFGSFIGTFAATYRNIVFYSASKFSQILKQSIISYIFAHMVFSINQMALGDPNQLTTFAEHMALIVNTWLTSTAKNEFSQWARIKDLSNDDKKIYTAKIPFTDSSFQFSEKDVNYQMKVQLTTQGIRMADLLDYSLSLPTATGFYKIELGKMLLWLSAPIVNFTVKKWAMKNYPETAHKMGLDKPFRQSIKDLFSRIAGVFKVKPETLNEIPLEAAVKTEIQEIDKMYFDSLAKNLREAANLDRGAAVVRSCQQAIKQAL